MAVLIPGLVFSWERKHVFTYSARWECGFKNRLLNVSSFFPSQFEIVGVMIFESMKKDYSKIKTIICQLKAGGKQQTATLRFFKKEDGYYTINPFGNNEIKLDENRLFEMEGMPDVLNYRGVLAVSSEPEF